MAFETKVILLQLADTALRTNSKAMYKAIARLLGVEGVAVKSFDEAKAELEADNE